METRNMVNGCTLLRKDDGVGGHLYVSDEVGGGVEVWDTALVDTSTLLAAIAWETNSNVIDLLKNTDDALSRIGMETKLAQEYIRRVLIALTGMTPGDDV